MTAVSRPPETVTQKVILHNVSWHTYEGLLAAHLESSGTRFTYDRGALEIMLPLPKHEQLKDGLMALVGALAEALQIDIEGLGSTTFRRADLARGFEPDACYYLTNAARMRQQEEIDPAANPPELVVEIDITNPSLNRFPIFAAHGVLEVWRYDGAQVGIYQLAAAAYTTARASRLLPGVTAELINQLLAASKTMKRADWLRLVRQSVPQ